MLLAPLITRSNEQALGKLWSALYIQALKYMVWGDEEKVPTQKPELAPWITNFLFHLFLNHATCWVLWLMGVYPVEFRHGATIQWTVCWLDPALSISLPLFNWSQKRESYGSSYGCWTSQDCSKWMNEQISDLSCLSKKYGVKGWSKTWTCHMCH